MTRTILMAALAAALAGPALCGLIEVDVNGSGYTTIQEGLDAAAGCDTVLVAPGVYEGPGNCNLSFGSKNLVLMSEAGPGSAIIDGGGTDRAFYLSNTGQDTISVIKGFWIRNGYTTNYNGGGLFFFGVGAVVEDCWISDCVASHNGGGLSVQYSRRPVKVRNCIFERNTATYRGGAAIVDHASAMFRHCLFTDNWTTATGNDGYGGGALHMNWIDENNDDCDVTRCTFVRNSSTGNGTGIHAWHCVVWGSVSQCIIAFNEGASLGFYSNPMFENLVFSNLYGNEGGDVEPGYSTLIDGDPLFCNMDSGDFSLCENSPCLPDSNDYHVLVGFAGSGCPSCTSAIEETSWGRMKSLFR
jgi:hypothetical protein